MTDPVAPQTAPVPVPQPPGRITWGSYASALRDRRKIIVRTIAETLASGGPVEDEMDAAEQVVVALERLHGIPAAAPGPSQ